MLFWLSEMGKIYGFQAFWSCSSDFPHYGDRLAEIGNIWGFWALPGERVGVNVEGGGGGGGRHISDALRRVLSSLFIPLFRRRSKKTSMSMSSLPITYITTQDVYQCPSAKIVYIRKILAELRPVQGRSFEFAFRCTYIFWYFFHITPITQTLSRTKMWCIAVCALTYRMSLWICLSASNFAMTFFNDILIHLLGYACLNGWLFATYS